MEAQQNHRRQRRGMQNAVQCVDADAIASGQEGMGVAVKSGIERCAFGLRLEPEWNPPRFKLSDEKKAVGEEQKPPEPTWKACIQAGHAENQAKHWQ